MKIDHGKIRKILILQYKPFGDILLNTGYLPFLKEKFPNAEIHFMVKRPYDQALLNNPSIDKLIAFTDKKKGIGYLLNRFKLVRMIRRNRYDMIIDQLRDTGSAIFTLFSKAKYKLGFQKKRFNYIYNINPPMGEKRYYSKMKFDLFKPIGIEEQEHELFFHIEDSSLNFIDKWLTENNIEIGNFVIIAPGSPIEKKKWLPENYALLADMIQSDLKIKIIFAGSPKEFKDIDNVIEAMKTEYHTAPKTTFNQAGALLKRSRLLICNDGGLNHLAIAVKTPSLSIFGSTNPVKWSGSELKDHWVLHNPNVDSLNDKTFGISVEVAFEKVKSILEELK